MGGDGTSPAGTYDNIQLISRGDWIPFRCHNDALGWARHGYREGDRPPTGNENLLEEAPDLGLRGRLAPQNGSVLRDASLQGDTGPRLLEIVSVWISDSERRQRGCSGEGNVPTQMRIRAKPVARWRRRFSSACSSTLQLLDAPGRQRVIGQGMDESRR